MINNWKLGIKMLGYAYGVKINVIIGMVMLALDIPIVIAGLIAGNQILGCCYLLMVVCMLPTQMLYSLNVSGMVLASPFRRKLQTSVPAVFTWVNMLLLYLICVMLYGIRGLCHGKLWEREYTELFLLALMVTAVMIYLGIAYKYFAVATLCLCLSLPALFINGFAENSRMGDLFGPEGLSFVQAVPAGFVMLAVGGIVHYLLTLLFYRAPLSKMAMAAPLKKEL